MAIPTYRGQAIPVFPFIPNYAVEPRITVNYRTAIVEALSTGEERIQLHPRELFGIQFSTYSLDGQQQGTLRRIIDLAEALPVAMPLWPFRTRLMVDAPEDSGGLTVDDTTQDPWEVFHEYALLWQDYRTFEVLQIESVAADMITLSVSTLAAFAAGAYVIPLAYGYLRRPPGRQLTDEHGVFDVVFEERFLGSLSDQTIPEDSLAYWEMEDGGSWLIEDSGSWTLE